MTTKLTLKVEKAIIERAKLYAKNTGRSLSQIVEHYLASLTYENEVTELSPKLKKIVGVVKLPKDFDEKKLHRDEIEKKHI